MLIGLRAAAGQAPSAPDAPRSTVVVAHPSGPPARAPEPVQAAITDAMRLALTFTAYDLTVHLEAVTAALEAQARVTVRNDGKDALPTLPLQLSSSLHFDQIRGGGKVLRFTARPQDSDADHTGVLSEADVLLPVPLAPSASTELTVDYAGTVNAESGRLDRAQASAALGRQTDWDAIAEGFTALRGFGNTVWYPAASVPALLGDGAKLLRERDRQKQQNSGATVRMAVTVEFTGDPANIVVLDGHRMPAPAPASLPTAAFPGVLRVALGPTPLGFAVPSLVLASRVETPGPLVTTDALPGEDAGNYAAAGRLLEPLFTDWFGGPPFTPLTLLGLPVEGALPFDDGDALLLSLRQGRLLDQPSQLAGSLAGPLTHVYFRSPRPWLREGVAGLMEFLWTERTEGRPKALAALDAARAALAAAEPGTPGAGTGQALIAAREPLFFSTKAMFALLMLRSLAGDDALRAALRAYDPAKDTTPDYFETLLETHGPDLHAFFKTWVYDDPGLPDLAISNVFSSKNGAGDQWLVSVEAANTGYAEAQVPLTVRSGETSTTETLTVPARGSVSRRVLLQGEPTEVDLNDGSVPEVQASVHRRVIQ